MIERIVEDWLTSVSERHFEVPFAQLLSFEGYTVVHVARPHGPMEQGKDVIALAPDGVPCAFQLKAGDLDLSDWRNPEQPLKGQVEDLLDLPIQHPSVPAGSHRSFLVTTGMLDDTLRQTIDGFNDGRAKAGKPILEVWVKGSLQKKVRDAFGRLVPSEIENLSDFLKLILADGKGLPVKGEICEFLESRFLDLPTGGSERQLRERCTELVLLGTYLVRPYQVAKNHIGEIEVWALIAAQLLHVGSASKESRRVAFASLGLVEVAIWSAMQSLLQEVADRKDYVEGDPFADAWFYRERVTYVAGYIAAALLWERYFDEQGHAEPVLRKFWESNADKMLLWGEGAVPSFLSAGWAWDCLSPKWEAERLILTLINAICQVNARNADLNIADEQGAAAPTMLPYGLANPYESIVTVLERKVGASLPPLGGTSLGQSYSLESLIKILVNRLLRQHLAVLWYGVTQLAFATYVPASPNDLWKWHNGPKGFLETRYAPHPTKWSSLQEEARNPRVELAPPFAQENPHLLLVFLLAVPHRLNPTTALMLERTDWRGGRWLLAKV